MNNLKFCRASYAPDNILDFDYCSGAVTAALDVTLAYPTLTIEAEFVSPPYYSAIADITLVAPTLISAIEGRSQRNITASMDFTFSFPLPMSPYVPNNVLVFGTEPYKPDNVLNFGYAGLVAKIYGRSTALRATKEAFSFTLHYAGTRQHSTHNAHSTDGMFQPSVNRLIYDGYSLVASDSVIYGEGRTASSHQRIIADGIPVAAERRVVVARTEGSDASVVSRVTGLLASSAHERVGYGSGIEQQVGPSVVSSRPNSQQQTNSVLYSATNLLHRIGRVIWTYTRRPQLGRSDPPPPIIIIPTDPEGVYVSFYHPPDQSAYIFRHDFEMVVTEGMVPLRVTSFSLSLDYDSWTWTWSAEIDPSQLSVLPDDGPFEVQVTLDLSTIRLLVEAVPVSRSFGNKSVKLSGRGINAKLASPYVSTKSFINTQIRTARQLADEVLLGTEWAVPDPWGVVDWNVADNAWSYNGTYMEALNRIAEAAASYVQPDPSQRLVIFNKKYPLPPWEWNQASNILVLPPDAITSEGWSWKQMPYYNAVWIAGSSRGGRLDRVLRTGSAADIVAATVVDDLMTATEATRQRGIAVLSEAGTQATYTVSMPYSVTHHIIMPGQFVYWAWPDTSKVGIVRSMSFSASPFKMNTTVDIEINESL